MRQTKIGEYSKKHHVFHDSLLTIKKNTFYHKIYYYFLNIPIIYKNKKFFKYISVGVVGEVVDFGLLFVLTSVLGVFYAVSGTISYIAGVLTNYILNKRFTFKYHTKNIWDQLYALSRVVLISLGSIIINTTLLTMLVEFAGLNYMIAKVITAIFLFFYVLIGNFYIFKTKIFKLGDLPRG